MSNTCHLISLLLLKVSTVPKTTHISRLCVLINSCICHIFLVMQRWPSIRILSALELRCPVCSSCAACCPSTPGTGTAWDRCVCSCWRRSRPQVHFQLHHAGICCICLLWFTVMYLPLVDLCSSLLRETAEEDVEENPAEFSEDKIWLKACTSFIRTRYVHDPDCRAEPLIDQYLLKPLPTYFFRLSPYLLQTPVEDSPAAAVFVCAAAQWEHPKVHRWGVAVLEPERIDPAGSDPGEDPRLSLCLGTRTPSVSLCLCHL